MVRHGTTRTTAALSMALCLLCVGQPIDAQTTAFTYQGRLTGGGSPASGPFDFIFRLHDLPSGGSQIGGDVTRDDVQVTNGMFTVDLNFGTSPFASTAGHYLEVAVRAGASTGAYTTLASRQPITSPSYEVETIGATTSAASADSHAYLFDARLPAAGSGTDRPDTRISDARYSPAFSGLDLLSGRMARSADIADIGGSGALRLGRRVRGASPPAAALATVDGIAVGTGQGPLDGYKLHVISQFNLGLRVQTDTAGGAVASFGGNGDFSIDAPGVIGGRFAVKPDGRVGVGTNTPLAKLDLLGGADSNGTNDPRAMAFQWNGGGFRHWLRTRHNSGLGNSNAIDFFVNNASFADGSTGPGAGSLHVMTLDSGRVGIGTINPTETLTVMGTVQSTSGGFKFPDGSVQTTAALSAAGNDRYYTKAADINTQLPATSGAILHLNLPAGTYQITATVMFWNTANFFGQDNGRYFECNFSGDSESYGGYLGGLTFNTTTYHAVLNISSGVDLICHVTTSGAPTNVFARDSRITAVKIDGTVTVQ